MVSISTLILAAIIPVVLISLIISPFKRNYYRKRGIYIEQKSINKLRLPKHWEITPNKPVPGCGDADIYLRNLKKNEVWVVEIKTYEGARKRSFFAWHEHEITRPNGTLFSKDAVKQVLRVAERLDAKPVIWLPLSIIRKNFKTKSGVLVVQGSHRRLEKALGARWI